MNNKVQRTFVSTFCTDEGVINQKKIPIYEEEKKNTTKNEKGVGERMEQKYVYGSKRTKEN